MKFQRLLPSVLAVCSTINSVHAWGAMGHETVAYIAQNFVSAKTKTFCQQILGDTSTTYLAAVSTWADSYRYTSAGSFSRPYHFIDSNDDPLHGKCSSDYTRDCGSGGCVVSAINNYTNTLLSGSDLDSLKFLVHFIGDLHQPLHDEALDLGGNEIKVTFAGTSNNLHHIWDTEMPQKLAGGSTTTTAKTWATKLTTAIKTGTYASQASSWISGINIDDPVTTTMGWVQQANAHVCDTVLAKGLTYVEGTDLSGAYYTAAAPVIQEQIARAGYRLAAWLNLIATGTTGL